MISRRLILLAPVLLTAGIVVQVIALVFVIIGWIPCLIWPGIINKPYQWITTKSARMMARAVMGSNRKTPRAAKAGTSAPYS